MKKKGFTLIEILLVVAMIAILAGIVIVAINPARQLGKTNNSQRWSDINAILNATNQYIIDNNGVIPTAIPQATPCSIATAEICKNLSGIDCTNFVSPTYLGTNETYMVDLPKDPLYESGTGIGYHIIKSANNRITVCAPDAEEGETISVSR
jgi:prepilin-type N-terminal cleavage/methylation domain-containing protein